MYVLALAALVGCGDTQAPAPTTDDKTMAEKKATPAEAAPPEEAPFVVPPQYKALFQPVTASKPSTADAAKADLGRMLYYDTRLSNDRTMSCNTCHQLDNFGVDSLPTSPGTNGIAGERNSPTSYHAFGHVAQFWDGRAKDVEEQAKGPILNPGEMAAPDEDTIVAVLTSIPGYQSAFARAFPGDADPVTYDNLATAIGAFERHLVTPSPFDAWLQGDGDAMTEAQVKGLETFVATGCTACHMGKFLGGTTYQKLGAVEPYPTEDLGRMAVTNNEADKHVFKTPSLRNIAKTGPYLHDGSVASLDEMVRLMAKHQLGRELEEAQVGSIVAFLGALTGTPDATYIAKPALPDDGPNTPKSL